MFHRPRSGLQLHPVMSSNNTPESTASDDTTTISTNLFNTPTDTPTFTISTDAAPSIAEPQQTDTTDATTITPSSFSQPTDTKETENMTNAYNNPNYSGADTQNDTSNSVSSTHAPSFTPATAARPGLNQAMVRSPYAYNQGYMAPTTTESPSVSTGRKLVLGEGITMSGEIEACDHLVVEGTVEATLKGASVLDIAQSGMFFGAVEINEATIAGRFEGDLVVNGRLTIRSTGTVMGTIAYKELAVEAGATIDGKINPMSVNRVATTDKKSTGSMKQNSQQSGKSTESGSELPFSAKNAVAA